MQCDPSSFPLIFRLSPLLDQSRFVLQVGPSIMWELCKDPSPSSCKSFITVLMDLPHFTTSCVWVFFFSSFCFLWENASLLYRRLILSFFSFSFLFPTRIYPFFFFCTFRACLLSGFCIECNLKLSLSRGERRVPFSLLGLGPPPLYPYRVPAAVRAVKTRTGNSVPPNKVDPSRSVSISPSLSAARRCPSSCKMAPNSTCSPVLKVRLIGKLLGTLFRPFFARIVRGRKGQMASLGARGRAEKLHIKQK
ncbi:hypothetical protein DFJ73DRAFT_165728 [Zopfochytrium polystomum]|nr:hypothetical protein DFJ73DRAFT_165728 [Zopfochytrium polystomum]